MSRDLKLSRGAGIKGLALILIVCIVLGVTTLYYGWYILQKEEQQQSVLSLYGLPTGSLNILCAGSLTRVLTIAAQNFEAKHPGVNIFFSAHGSLECASLLKQGIQCDIIFVSDFNVIKKELYFYRTPWNPIVNYADWWVDFAGNQIVIAYNPTTTIGRMINETNWYTILVSGQGRWARANPDADPCGYRTLITLNISDTFYPDNPGAYPNYPPSGVLNYVLNPSCPNMVVAAKEYDIIGPLQAGQYDAGFTYLSLALQFGLPYIELPENVSLGSVLPEYDEWYSQWSISTLAKTYWGSAIKYAVTIPNTAKNRLWAIEFLKFFLSSEGQAILTAGGQPVINPPIAEGNLAKVPSQILSLCKY
ncbi:MAG: substrate-binding domain-containing protein [Candidatus Freyarchaeota archaeon]